MAPFDLRGVPLFDDEAAAVGRGGAGGGAGTDASACPFCVCGSSKSANAHHDWS